VKQKKAGCKGWAGDQQVALKDVLLHHGLGCSKMMQSIFYHKKQALLQKLCQPVNESYQI
jgi:hypothetical protein